MTAREAAARQVWLGAALASLFFMPLIGAADAQVFFLHWQSVDTYELAIAYAAITLAAAVALWLVEYLPPRARIAVLMALLLIPFAAAALTLLRHFTIKESLAAWVAATPARVALVAAAAALAVMTMWRPKPALAAINGMLLIVSPVTFVFWLNVIPLATADPTRPGAIGRVQNRPAAPPRSNVLVLIFDELSYSRIYADGRIRPDLPALHAFSLGAKAYHNASSPGHDTLEAMAGVIWGVASRTST